jgi:ankyrin repeat protein
VEDQERLFVMKLRLLLIIAVCSQCLCLYGAPVAAASKKVPEVRSIHAKTKSSTPDSANSNAKEKSDAVLDAMFNKPAEEKARKEMEACLAEVRSQPNRRKAFAMLSNRMCRDHIKGRTTPREIVLPGAKEQFRMMARGGCGGISGMKYTMDMLVTIGLDGDQIAAMMKPLEDNDKRGDIFKMNQYLAEAYLGHKQWDNAEKVYKELIESQINTAQTPLFRLGIAKTYLGAGKKNEAAQVLEELDALARSREDESSTIHWLALSRLYVSLGEQKKSIELDEALATNPKVGLRSRKYAWNRLNRTRSESGLPPMAKPDSFTPPPSVAKEASIFDEVAKEDTRGLVSLLKDNPKAVRQREKGKTALHKATFSGNHEAVRLLLKYGADVNAKVAGHEARGCVVTPLHYACGKYLYDKKKGKSKSGRVHGSKGDGAVHGHTTSVKAPVKADLTGPAPTLEIVQLLLQKKANPNTASFCRMGIDGGSPLGMAASEGDATLVRILLKHGASVEMKRHPQVSAAAHAVASDQPAILKTLVEELGTLPKGGRQGSLLHEAAAAGGAEVLDIILEREPDLNAKNRRGETPFEMAMRFSRKDIFAEAYRRHGIPVPDIKMSLEAAASRAAILMQEKKYAEAKAALLEYPGAINTRPRKESATILFASALKSGDAEAAADMQKWMIANGLDVKETPVLHSALRRWDLSALRLLVAAGADVNFKHKGETPLGTAQGLLKRSPSNLDLKGIVSLLKANGGTE